MEDEVYLEVVSSTPAKGATSSQIAQAMPPIVHMHAPPEVQSRSPEMTLPRVLPSGRQHCRCALVAK